MTPRLAAVSIDLDEIPCYTAIHGLPAPEGDRAHAIYDRALPRLLDWLDTRGLRATFFVVGRDLERDEVRARLAEAARRGHELASHSFSHRYDLVRATRATLVEEIARADSALESLGFGRPVGFRAPGYTMSEALIEVLVEAGYAYDSSLFPCPPYYAAKAAILASMALRGRRSRSILDDPRVLVAPGDPYRIGTRRWRRGAGLLELPIGVLPLPFARAPFIGTSVILAGERGARFLGSRMVGRPFVGLELHGIDLADATLDDLDFLRDVQPDLAHDAAAKRRRLEAALDPLVDAGYRFVTMAEAAREFSA